ncbi:hypothetical protein HMI56_001954 [Coelomomyces lativittatus]|nr:hypothetical protein HMI56_001954 [Coelomomyces lativittatus]
MESFLNELNSTVLKPLNAILQEWNSTIIGHIPFVAIWNAWKTSTKWAGSWGYELFYGQGKAYLELTHDKIGVFVVALAFLLGFYLFLIATRFLQRLLFLLVNIILKLLVVSLSFLLLLSFLEEYFQQSKGSSSTFASSYQAYNV